MLDRRRLATPRAAQSVLIEPSGCALRAISPDALAGRLRGVEFAGTSGVALRAGLLRELEIAPEQPVVATGHQAEFFHAGVFAKAVAVDELARLSEAATVFLIADHDEIKTDTLTVPVLRDGTVEVASVALPDVPLGIASEAARVGAGASSAWGGAFRQLGALIDDAQLLAVFRDGFLAALEADPPSGEEPRLVDAISAGRIAAERALGLFEMHQVCVSRLATTGAYRSFAAAMMLDAPRSQACYNAAIDAYRARHRVRTTARPVPKLQTLEARVEIPLWSLDAAGGRRRVYVEASPNEVALWADDALLGRAPRELLRDSAALRQNALFDSLRPRALMLSGFARLLLADLFVHGIGGAKYDEVTDDWLARWLGVERAPLACVTATSYLPLPVDATAGERLRTARHRARDVRYNPQRYASDLPQELVARRAALIAESQALRGTPRSTRPRRRAVWEAIRQTNAALVETAGKVVATLQDEKMQCALACVARDRALDREVFFAMLPYVQVADLVDRIRRGIRSDAGSSS